MKELAKKQRHIHSGEKKRYLLIRLYRLIQKAVEITTPITMFINAFIRKPQEKNTEQNIVITGGNLQNKGAQAMVFALADHLKEKFPDKKIYVFSSRQEEDRETYTFDVLPYYLKQKIKIFSKTNPYSPSHEIIDILSNTDFIVDVSGYALSSQQGIHTNLNFLFSIIIARHFSLPCYYLPQSVGSFDYSTLEKMLLFPLFKVFLSYPKKFYVRERNGLKYIHRFTKKNVRYSSDIVLQNKNYSIPNIFRVDFSPQTYSIQKNSIGIIPNQKVMERLDESTFYQLYRSIIERLLQRGKNVYLMPHSTRDFAICKGVKTHFKDDDRVIFLGELLNCIELEKIIEQFDFVVASRYHSIIHAYRNGVPALIIGWAVKYSELAEKFNQRSYISDIRKLDGLGEVMEKLEKMLNRYPVEKEKITTVLEQVQDENIFADLFLFEYPAACCGDERLLTG